MILSRYIGNSILRISFLALFCLIAIFSFFSLADQLGDTGVGDYGVLAAIHYVLLTVPRLSYELFPIATVIGSMAAFGLLANTSELTVIKTTGVSTLRLARFLIGTALILCVVSTVIGEVIVPVSEQSAKENRSVALTQQISLKTKHGLWSQDGKNYINIRKILPGNRVENIYIYEFDQNYQLITYTSAKQAQYDQNQWLLRDVQITTISEQQVTLTQHEHIVSTVLLSPEGLAMIAIEPRYLSINKLANYINYLSAKNQRDQLYEQALWMKVINPFAIVAMLLLALCVINSEARAVGLGQRVFIGALIGITFHLVNQLSSHLGIVYGFTPFISVTLPTIALLTYIFYTLVKKL